MPRSISASTMIDAHLMVKGRAVGVEQSQYGSSSLADGMQHDDGKHDYARD